MAGQFTHQTHQHKKIFLLGALALAARLDTAAQEYKVDRVESIVPGGVGRSRIIEATSDVDSDAATTERIDGKKTIRRSSVAIRRSRRSRRPSC